MGNVELVRIAKRVSNPFWKEIIYTMARFQKSIIFSTPANMLLSPIWDNSLFRLGDKVMKSSDFRNTGIERLTQVAQIVNMESNDFYTCEDLHLLYNITITNVQYLKIKSAIRRGATELGITMENCNSQQNPIQPLLVSLATACVKGCQLYYKVLGTKINCKSVTLEAENKWHERLGMVLSTDFWNNSWRLVDCMRVENKVKWMQTKLLKGIVATNLHVNKYVNPLVSSLCSFNCGQIESAEHLFFNCLTISRLWTELRDFVFPAAIIEISKVSILFGNIGSRQINTKENYLILLSKFYIWRERCAKRSPNFLGLKIYIESHLKNLCLNAKFGGKYIQYCNFWEAVSDIFDVAISDTENEAVGH